MFKIGPFGREISEIFDHPDDVPSGKGWVDSPAKIVTPAPKRKAKPKRKPKAA